MKFNYKKIASVFASAVMLSSTIGFAAAATYPSPFTDGSAVVYGTAGASSDFTAAIDIYDQLTARVTGTTGVDASVSGEAKAIETGSQSLYLGDYMNTTKTTFSKDQLPNILADGKVTDDDGTELDYELKLDTPKTSVKFGETADTLSEPVIYADFDSADYTYDLRVVFPTAANVTLLTDESIKLFGKEYTFSGSSTDLTITKIVLFEKSTPVKINSGEEVTAEGHTISVSVEDGTTASITVNGVTESKAQGWSGKIGGVDIYVKNVFGPSVAGTERFVELYLSSSKLTLEHGNEVKLGTEYIDGTAVNITNSSNKMSAFKITVTPYSFEESIKYLKQGDSFVDPVFGGLKFELASLTPELESTARDEIIIKASGETKASLEFTNKAGKLYSMNLIGVSDCALNETRVANGTNGCGSVAIGAGAHTYNATELKVGTKEIVTDTTGIVNATEYFITCSNEYTQIWELKSMSASSARVRVEDKGSGSSSVDVSMTLTDGETGTLTLADGSSATLTMNGTLGFKVNKGCNHLYTKNGAMIDLALADAPVGNLSSINITEETAYNGGAFTGNNGTALGKSVMVRLDWNFVAQTGKDMKIRDVLGTAAGAVDVDYFSDDVGDYDYHYLTKYGTYVKRTGDSDKTVKIYYPEDAMAVGFYIGEVSSSITPGTTGTGGGGQISIVKDSEVSSVSSKHLIVVGGSCVNTVAAKILGSTTPLCGADFSAVTQVSSGGYIIKTVESPYNDAKVAMLVAGYNAADTTTAVKRAMVIDGVTTDKDSEEIFPILA